MHSEGSYEDVLSQLTDGLAWSTGWAESYNPPSKSAIFHARQRLGPEPMKALCERAAVPIATETTPGTWQAGRRLAAPGRSAPATTAIGPGHRSAPGATPTPGLLSPPGPLLQFWLRLVSR